MKYIITIGERDFELTHEQAEHVWNELATVFGSSTMKEIDVIPEPISTEYAYTAENIQ